MDESTRDTIIWACFGLSAIQALGVPLHFFNITWDRLVSHRSGAVTTNRSENRFPRFLFAGCISSTTVGVSVFLYGRHPLWLVAIIVIAVALILAAFLAGRKQAEPQESPAREFGKLANEDSADMNKRLLLCGKTAKLNVETVEQYIDATFKIVNTSMFSIMSEKVEGYASYRGYSGEKCYLSRTPIIADILNVFHLSRGDLGELTLKLYVPLEITDNIAAANDRLEVDFSEVRVYFRFNGTGGHTRFSWFGDVVEVSSGLAVSNETLSKLGIIPKPSGPTIHAVADEQPRLSDEQAKLIKRTGVLESKAGQADWLVGELERIWHLYNNENDKLLYPLGELAVPEVVKEFRDKQLWAFRIQYRGHVGGVRSNEPDFHSDIMDAPYPCWSVPYLDLLRKLKVHAEALRNLARSLESETKL
jgi:hypothetical protein